MHIGAVVAGAVIEIGISMVSGGLKVALPELAKLVNRDELNHSESNVDIESKVRKVVEQAQDRQLQSK